jgi:hypothetical protein
MYNTEEEENTPAIKWLITFSTFSTKHFHSQFPICQSILTNKPHWHGNLFSFDFFLLAFWIEHFRFWLIEHHSIKSSVLLETYSQLNHKKLSNLQDRMVEIDRKPPTHQGDIKTLSNKYKKKENEHILVVVFCNSWQHNGKQQVKNPSHVDSDN